MSRTLSFDIIIIGSGPAGCAAAVTCVKAGLSVLIVTDKVENVDLQHSSPGILESIHPGVSSLLTKIGIGGAEIVATRAKYTGIFANQSYRPLGEDNSGPWMGMHIHRETFDHALLNLAQEHGVTVRFNEKVENILLEKDRVVGIKTSSAELFCKYMIDASGKNAVAGQKLNFRRKYFSPLFVCWTGISECVQEIPFDATAAHFIPNKNGWTWLALQLPDHCAWTRLSVKGEKNLEPPGELKNCKTVGKVQTANMRWRLYRPVCKEGVVLCGDAAGILDPAAGQGIFNALWSGVEAGQTVVSCLHHPELEAFHLARYDDWFLRQFEIKVKQLKEYYQENGIQF